MTQKDCNIRASEQFVKFVEQKTAGYDDMLRSPYVLSYNLKLL